jgi:hypothetical protein
VSQRASRRERRQAAAEEGEPREARRSRQDSTGWGIVAFRVAALVLGALAVYPAVATWAITLARPIPKAPLIDPLIAVVAIVGLALGLGARADTLADWGQRTLLRPSPRAFAAIASVVVLALSSAFAWYCFGAQPGILDEMTQRFQARLLRGGRLSLVAEPLRQFFETEQTLSVDGRFFGEFPIGSSILMLAGDLVRAPWLVNPILATLTAWGLYRFLARTGDESTARLTTVLFVASPFVLFMSASQMNHTKTLAALVLALCALAEWTTAETAARRNVSAALVGLGVGLLASMRPYDAVLVAIPIGVFQLAILARGPAKRWTELVPQIIAGTIPVAIMLIVNAKTTGAMFAFGYDVSNGPGHRPGFHVDPLGEPFTPMRGLVQTLGYFAQLNRVMLEWPLPALILATVTLAFRRSASRWELLLLALTGAVALGYWAYWHPGNSFGPRFLFLVVPVLLLFIAQMPGAVTARFGSPVIRRMARLAIPVCLALAWIPVVTPWHAGVFARASSYRNGPFPPEPDIAKAIEAANVTNGVVFVREPWHGRLTSRLRALGVPALRAGQIVANVDACALQLALDQQDSVVAEPLEKLRRIQAAAEAAGPARPDPRFIAEKSLAFVPGRELAPVCQAELIVDQPGTMRLDLFLAHNDFDADGRLGGRVVFVRDYGPRNALLRQRFADRVWYRWMDGKIALY